MGTIQGIAGGTLAFSAASGGKVYAVNNLGTSPIQVVPANSSRQKLTFHNPGTQDVFVSPAVTATGTTLTPSLAALGGTFRIFANGGTLIVEGECQTAWNAFAAANANNPLTVMDSNV
jgi:hypothetical protein